MQKFVTSDEKLINYENPQRRKHRVEPRKSTTSTQKRNVFGKKILIYIWWDEWDGTGMGINGTKILQSSIRSLGRKKRPYTRRGHRPLILQHNNAKPHIVEVLLFTKL